MPKKPQKKQSSLPSKLNPFRWLMRHWWRLLIIIAAVIAAYGVYLDAQIVKQFSGNKWQVPAQIFARPMHLELKQEITIKEIVEELELLGYRKVRHADDTGEYQLKATGVRIQRRAFHFPHGQESEISVDITLANGRISSLRNLKNNRALDEIYLEPWLVTRLMSSGREDRMLVNLKGVPPSLIKALVLVEDKDFYQHYGIAPLSILRALIANVSAGRAVQGGSTLTQQLVKNLFLTNEKSLVRKAKEALMALIIDARYSKDEIIEAYLNEVFLGQNGNTGVHGFGLASLFYFDRPIAELNVSEIATLVGIIKGPSYYNPRRHPERVTERRNLVLRILFENNELQRNEYEYAINQPLNLASGASLKSGKHPAFMNLVRRELKTVLADPNMRESGLKVFTTLDSVAQRKAEEAVIAGVKAQQKRMKLTQLQSAMVVTDIKSGEVRSIVGDANPQYQGFNRALDAKRAIGSLIKPTIYLTALERAAQYNLATPLTDEAIKLKSTYGKMWEPKNADKKFRGQVTLVDALTQSLNVPTVNLGMEVGLDDIASTIRRLGVNEPIDIYPAMTLGAVNFSPMQVNQMYQTIANNGRYIPLHAVTAVLSPKDKPLWKFSARGEQRADLKATYLLNYALHKVTREGTAKQIRKTFGDINMAGKTGTTDDYRDSWFSGFDNNILVTTWMGKDNNEPINLSGATGAMQLFIGYQKLQQPKSLVRRYPKGLGIAHFDEESGALSRPGCANTISVPAILDALPPVPKTCNGEVRGPLKKSLWERLFGN
ncbi:penicillin-binding protein 1B [Paraglaciecola agarilytica]|uniref:Penicillin-binding protein 1B n=1 Tax=Paraglaciecola chathamensis TaxID=368405 RepID=A0ABS0WAZ5_9ALTE|nr:MULTISPECIES: penicillin-binding protein 1B [Paraglaciecola]MBJ2135624.1 penicillin-binding protein 1B [Paraglaciecola chathamensis]MBU3018873.1 penicillin-binding protein 1B [Paraglaciecola agarilytica]MDO6559113.1 penicillin-binding protein 1B [Paraglaciecola chathamensis]